VNHNLCECLQVNYMCTCTG